MGKVVGLVRLCFAFNVRRRRFYVARGGNVRAAVPRVYVVERVIRVFAG